MGAESSRQHALGLQNDDPPEDSADTPQVEHESGTSPPSPGEPASKDGTKRNPVPTGTILSDNQAHSQPNKTQAPKDNVLVETDDDVSPKKITIKNSLPSLPSLTESSEVYFHQTMHNQLVQFDGCSIQFLPEPSVSNAGDGCNRVELADTMAPVTQGSSSPSSGVIPRTFECDDSTTLEQSKENSPSDVVRAPELRSNSSLSSVAVQSKAPSVLSHKLDARNFKLADEDPELAIETREEMPLLFAATYADAANLAMKYPHLASKILGTPLRHGSSPDNKKPFVPTEDDCQVSEAQTPRRHRRERGSRGPPKTHQPRKLAIHDEKREATSPQGGPQKDNETNSRLEREETPGAHTVPIKKVNRRLKSPAGTGDEGGISDETQGNRAIGDDLTRNVVRSGNDTYLALEVDELCTLGVSKAIRGHAEHSKKQSGTQASPRHYDTRDNSNRTIVNPNTRKGIERRPSTNPRTRHHGGPKFGDTPEEAAALRAQDRVLGSHVLQGDNQAMTPPSAAEIEELLGRAMLRANLAKPSNTSPPPQEPSNAPRSTSAQIDPLVSPRAEDSLEFLDRLIHPDQLATSGVSLLQGGRKTVPRSGKERTQPRIGGFSYGDTSSRPTLDHQTPSMSNRTTDQTNVTTKLSSSLTPHRRVAAKTSTSEIHMCTSFQGVSRETPVQRTPVPLGGATTRRLQRTGLE